jgi:oligoribonuclease NrnB/cAMP/cGMP phosphodiesterase (DHH superfamily)
MSVQKYSTVVAMFHRIDLDGWMSGAIIADKYLELGYKIVDATSDTKFKAISSNTIYMLPFNYGDKIPEGLDTEVVDEVILADISLPASVMSKLGDKLTVLDHHKTAIETIESLDINCICHCSTEVAACELTWEYFHPNVQPPTIVTLLGLYDSFRHLGTDLEKDVMQFQYGARSFINDYSSALQYLNKWDSKLTSTFIDAGKAILQYLKVEAQDIYATRGTQKISSEFIGKTGVKFASINRMRFNPANYDIDYTKDGYQGVVSYFIEKGGIVNVSLYSDLPDIDVSKIAKAFGGGGHKGAAGFRLAVNDTAARAFFNS